MLKKFAEMYSFFQQIFFLKLAEQDSELQICSFLLSYVFLSLSYFLIQLVIFIIQRVVQINYTNLFYKISRCKCVNFVE